MLSDFLPSVDPHLYLPLVVLICSIIQSLTGVGLLLFGTPTLLLLGVSFGDALAALLPCSVTVNLCQLSDGLPRNTQAGYRIVGITLPMIFLGLLIALWGIDTQWMPIVVGVSLLGLGILRLSSSAAALLNKFVAGYQNAYLAGMGLLHGLTNMGGGLLIVYSGTLSDDKEEIRRTIAFGYLAFALTQLLILVITQSQLFRIWHLCLPVISLLAYLIGNRVFRHLNTAQFGRLVTTLILMYGIVTVSKAFA